MTVCNAECHWRCLCSSACQYVANAHVQFLACWVPGVQDAVPPAGEGEPQQADERCQLAGWLGRSLQAIVGGHWGGFVGDCAFLITLFATGERSPVWGHAGLGGLLGALLQISVGRIWAPSHALFAKCQAKVRHGLVGQSGPIVGTASGKAHVRQAALMRRRLQRVG